jgi:hypothetical protein
MHAKAPRCFPHSLLSNLLIAFGLCCIALNVLVASNPAKSYEAKFPKHIVKGKGLRVKNLSYEAYIRPRSIPRGLVIPNAFDLRTALGTNLSPIEDQGQCGSCWAFSLTATSRDGYVANNVDPGRLSQQYLVDCASNSYGCNGGFFDSADFISENGQGLSGSPSWNAYPYTAMTGACRASNSMNVSSIRSWSMLGSPTAGPSIWDIQSYMTDAYKPVSITVAAGAGDWSYYSGGIYNGCVPNAQTDHMINIVGWDNEGAQFDSNGNLPAGKGIWILRNSWGTEWGENGWMRMKMTDANGNRCNSVAQNAAGFYFEQDSISTTTPAPTTTPASTSTSTCPTTTSNPCPTTTASSAC